MKKLISTMVMLLILMFALSTTVQAYSMSFTGKTEVESGETFSVTISVDEPTTLANGQLAYDSSLFTFVGATQTNMAAQAYPAEGKVKWMYTELVEEPVGVSAFTFTFKAAEVEETKKGTFTLNDFIVTTKEEAEYDQATNTISGKNSVEVTINKKVQEPTWTLDPSKDFELEVGDTKTIKTDGDVTWTSSDPKVATVDKNGKVTAVKEGTVTITATDKDGNVKSVKVKVVAKDELTLSPSGDIKLEIGETQKIETNKDVEWSTSNSKVATVDKNGNIKAVGAGTATITAKDKDGNIKTIKVTVVKKEATGGNKDNTTTPDKKLPQTGEDFTRFACLGIAAVILAAGLVFNKKAKNLGKLFVILPLVAIMSISGAVNAIKLVDDETMKAGIFTAGELLENQDVIAVSPCKDFTTEDSLNVEILQNIASKYFDAETVTVEVVKSGDSETEVSTDNIPTGAIIEVTCITAATEEMSGAIAAYQQIVLLYGDANGDGKICNCLDVNVIRQDYVFNNKAEGVYKLAADLYADGTLNVRDVQRMVKKYLGTLDGSVVTPFPGEKEITLDPNDDFELEVGESQKITADTDVEWSWDEDSDVADVVVNDDGSITITGKKPGEIDITATDENGNEKTITVTIVSDLDEGETLDESEAIARVESTGKMYVSVQYAVNAAADTDTVTIMKNETERGTTLEDITVLESITVPENKNLILDLNGHILEGTDVEYTITNNGDLTIMNSDAENFGQVMSAEDAANTIITKGNLTIMTNETETSKVTLLARIKDTTVDNPTATVKNIGTNNTIKVTGGADFSGWINGNKFNAAILDENTGSTIIVAKANIGGSLAAIKKTGSGSIIIGANEQDLWGAATGPSDKAKLSMYGRDSALLVDENVDVKFYNGVLNSSTDGVVSKNTDGTIHEFDETREGFGTTLTMQGGPDSTFAYYKEGATGETDDESLAVARVESTGKMYTTVQYAVNAAANTDTVTMLKDATEAVEIPTDKNITLDLNGKTLTAPEAGTAITVNSTKFTIKNGTTTQATLSNKNGVGIKVNNANAEITLQDDIKYENNTIETVANFAGKITVNDAEWEGSASDRFIMDNGAGTITVCEGNYKGYSGIIEQTGAGTITIGDKDKEISTESPYLLAHDSVVVAENSTINFYNGKVEARSIAGFVDSIDGKREDATLFNNMSSAYYIKLDEGETLDEAGAVARVESTGKMYTTVQYAVNAAANTDTVTMLKDSTEAVTIPAEKDIILSMGNQKLTGIVNEKGTSYAVKVLGDLTVKSTQYGATIELLHLGIEENTATIILEGDGNLNLETITNEDGTTTALDIGNQNKNTTEMIDNNNIKEHAVILNNGTGDINVDGFVTISGYTNNRGYYGAITDKGEGSNITITKGRVNSSTIGIVKTGSGDITIGKNENSVLNIGTTSVSGEKTALLVNPNVKVNFYQGELTSTTFDPEIGITDPNYPNGYYHGVCLDEIKTIKTGSKDKEHSFDAINENKDVILEGSAGETSAYYRKIVVGETKDESEAVAINTSTGMLYSKLQTAATRVRDGQTVKLLKSVSESVTFEKGKSATLDLNGYTLSGNDEDEIDPTITVKGNLTIANSSETEGVVTGGKAVENGVNNIYVTGAGNLTVNENVKIEQSVFGHLIHNDGIGNITIDGATVNGAFGGGTYGIYAEGTNGNIYVNSGEVSAYTATIYKSGAGNIYIGKDSVVTDGIEGTQTDILTAETTPILYLHAAVTAVRAGEETNVYWYNGELSCNYTVDSGKYNPICMNLGDEAKEFTDTRTNCITTAGSSSSHSYIFAEGIDAVSAGTEALTEVLEAAQ